jgi:hypothetical protein
MSPRDREKTNDHQQRQRTAMPKETTIKLRCTEEEKALIKEKAQISGFNGISSYLLHCALVGTTDDVSTFAGPVVGTKTTSADGTSCVRSERSEMRNENARKRERLNRESLQRAAVGREPWIAKRALALRRQQGISMSAARARAESEWERE